jgi:hypothetical protein
MSREYAERKIAEALKEADGNATRARQKVIAWAMDDVRLLQGLVRPHMTGITAHAVSRVLRKKTLPAEEIPEFTKAVDMPENIFGKEILGLLGGGGAKFGGEIYESVSTGHKKASKSHVDAIMRMAKKTTDK